MKRNTCQECWTTGTNKFRCSLDLGHAGPCYDGHEHEERDLADNGATEFVAILQSLPEGKGK